MYIVFVEGIENKKKQNYKNVNYIFWLENPQTCTPPPFHALKRKEKHTYYIIETDKNEKFLVLRILNQEKYCTSVKLNSCKK